MQRPFLPVLLCGAILWAGAPGSAYGQGSVLILDQQELLAWEKVELERYVDAREMAEEILDQRPRSVVAHTVLGVAHHYAEGNLPRSLFHLRRARELLESQYGPAPIGDEAFRWHARVLLESAITAGEMERYEEKLELLDRYDALYSPRLTGHRIWPLLKLRRIDEARLWAKRALDEPDELSRRMALNGLCAIENEAGNRQASYAFCAAHAEETWHDRDGAVYLCNAGEAARGLLRFDEAERYYIEATSRDVSWYGNPWMSLADLYIRSGRIAEAASAAQKMERYAGSRPPHTEQHDMAERARTMASLLLVGGAPERALVLTDRAVRFPDRRASQSRAAEVDQATAALLHRRALMDAAEVTQERGSVLGHWDRALHLFSALWLRVQGWLAARRVVALLDRDHFIQGLVEAEGHLAQGTPPWLASELIEVLGPGPMLVAIEQARESASTEGLDAYLDAYEAEAVAARGELDGAAPVARRARSALPAAEVLLKARMTALLARAAEARGDLDEAATHYIKILETDATLLRRARLALPVEVRATSSSFAVAAAERLAFSPRLEPVAEAPLTVHIDSDGISCRLCLSTSSGVTLDCERVQLRADDLDGRAAECASVLHTKIIAPRIDMSVLDPSALEGGSLGGGSVEDLLQGAHKASP